MSEGHASSMELPNIVGLLASRFKGTAFGTALITWENLIFSLIIAGSIFLAALFARKRIAVVPGRLSGAFEMFVGGIDDFVCGIIGPHGRKYVPFIGTLFIYILAMNLSGLVPLMRSPTASWSTTLALALCVFVYVQYAAFKELGGIGYLDHMLGKPRGMIAVTIFVPAIMLFLHVISEFIRPISLSLRLRSNIWGDDMLLAFLSSFGLKGVPLLLFSSVLALIASLVQALVFSLLTTIYFALVLAHEHEEA